MRLVAMFVAVGLVGCPAENTPFCTAGQSRCHGSVIQECTAAEVWLASDTDCADYTQVCSSGVCVDGDGGVCTKSAAGNLYYVCDGTEVVACDRVAEAGGWDCADDMGGCFDYGGNLGAECVFPLGEGCVYCLNGDCSDWYAVACGTGSTPNPSYGCDVIVGCVALTTSGCAPAEPFTPYCDGNYLVWECLDYDNFDVTMTVDCTDAEMGSGVCNAGACEHSTVGGPCDDDVHCVGGLTCSVSTGSGVCQK